MVRLTAIIIGAVFVASAMVYLAVNLAFKPTANWPTPKVSATPEAPYTPPPAPRSTFGDTPSAINLSGSDAVRAPEEDHTHYGAE
jgi:hypothetical protein